jgi:bla regulator protein blaR1
MFNGRVLASSVAVLLGLISTLAQAPKSAAQSQPTARPSFEVVSIKLVGFEGRVTMSPQPNGLYAEAVTARMLMRNAYRVPESRIEGGPAWITEDRFTVNARAAGPLGPGQLPFMMQAMLEDRFKLKVHRETREMPVYVLTAEKNGHKMRPAKAPNAAPELRGFQGREGEFNAAAVNLTQLVNLLQQFVGRPIIDKTGDTALYDFTLRWSSDGGQADPFAPGAPAIAPPADASDPTLFGALQDQLGLRLNSEKGPVEIIVIDSIERPTEN